jgi:hypothetical protein
VAENTGPATHASHSAVAAMVQRRKAALTISHSGFLKIDITEP